MPCGKGGKLNVTLSSIIVNNIEWIEVGKIQILSIHRNRTDRILILFKRSGTVMIDVNGRTSRAQYIQIVATFFYKIQ